MHSFNGPLGGGVLHAEPREPPWLWPCMSSIGYTPRARLLSDLATECRRHEVAKSLGNQARGVQPACTMTTQNSKIRLISSIALKPRLITYLST